MYRVFLIVVLFFLSCATEKKPVEELTMILWGVTQEPTSENVERIKKVVAEGAKINVANGNPKFYPVENLTYYRKIDSESKWGDADEKAALAMMKFLVENGADLTVKSHSDDWTLLHYSVQTNMLDMTKYLISKGLDVNAKNAAGRTPITWATEYEMFKALIDAGADLNIPFNSGVNTYTVLETVSEKHHPKIYKLLIDHGAKKHNAY